MTVSRKVGGEVVTNSVSRPTTVVNSPSDFDLIWIHFASQYISQDLSAVVGIFVTGQACGIGLISLLF